MASLQEEEANSELNPEFGEENTLKWKTPIDWKKLPLDPMRIAVYETKQNLKVTVSRFPGDTGGDLANINRWRRQMNLSPVSNTKDVQVIQVPAGNGKFLKLQGKQESDDKVMLVFWIPHKGFTYFFKAMGKREQIELSETNFITWIRSIHSDNS